MPVLSSKDDAERFVRAPDPRISVVLLYGPDHGLIVERGTGLAAAATQGGNDPMNLLRLEGEAVAADPLSLVDEANTITMFGGRRAIRVRAGSLRGGSRTLLPAVKPLLETPPLDALVIIEAGDLKKSDGLVTLCSQAATAAVIACYGDSDRDLAALINDAVRLAGKSIDPEARVLLQAFSGGDRIATRGELEKLLAYVGSAERITLADATASVGDTANAAIESVLDGAFAGDVAVMMAALDRLKAEGMDANTVIIRALGHAWRLGQVAGANGGRSRNPDSWKQLSAVYSRKGLLERQLSVWSAEAVIKQISALGAAMEAIRVSPRLADAALDRTLLGIALAARRAR